MAKVKGTNKRTRAKRSYTNLVVKEVEELNKPGKNNPLFHNFFFKF